MSLVEARDPAHQSALDSLASKLRAGNESMGAVLLNLQEEDRVSTATTADFQRRVAHAEGALETIDTLCSPGACDLPVSRNETWSSNVTLCALRKYGYIRPTAILATQAPPKQRLVRACGLDDKGSAVSLWVTKTRDDDATTCRDRLGLERITAGEILYRVEVPLAGHGVFLPTALDAGSYSAWRRPPTEHREEWGLTRHLKTDAASEPELIVRRTPSTQSETATRVGQVTTLPSHGYLSKRRPRP